MRKIRHQRKRQLGLVKVHTKLDSTDLKSRGAPEGEFRVIGVNQITRAVWIEATMTMFADAKHLVDTFQDIDDVVYYIHNDSNRIIYDSKKE